MSDIHAHKILILDFGSQYTQLIARRVREIGVYSEVRAFDITEEEIREYNPNGIIMAGGPESVTELDSPRAPQCVFEMGLPVFGICYGMQTMAEQLGGKVEGSNQREFGYAQIQIDEDNALFKDIKDHVDAKGGRSALRVHRDRLHAELPDCRHGLGREAVLRRTVPPGSDPHPAGPAHSRALRAGYL